MKCNQCEMLQISMGLVNLPTHEIGCPNTHKDWDEEEQEWVARTPEPEEDDDWWPENDGEDEEEEDDDPLHWDEDAGGTGHGDISHSDADPGL